MGDKGKEVVPSPPPKRMRSSDSSSSAVIRGLKNPSNGVALLDFGDRGTRDVGMADPRTERKMELTFFMYVVRKLFLGSGWVWGFCSLVID